MRKAHAPLLEIKISGPGVKPGAIALGVLFKICHEAQEAVNRQAQAIEFKVTGKPLTEAALRECRLELVGLRKGGNTILEFSPASKQLSLLPKTKLLGVEAVSEVATTLRAVSQRRGKWKAPDPRVLDSLEDLGSIFEEGVDRLQWIAPANGHKRTTAEFVPSFLPKIKRRKQESLPLEGLPEPTEHPIRVDPGRLIGAGFFTPRTIDQLIAEQHVRPIVNISILSGAIPDDDVDEFVAEIYRDRKG